MKYLVLSKEDKEWLINFLDENSKIIPDYVSINPIELENGNFAINENVLFSEELKELRELINYLGILNPDILGKLNPVDVGENEWKKYFPLL